MDISPELREIIPTDLIEKAIHNYRHTAVTCTEVGIDPHGKGPLCNTVPHLQDTENMSESEKATILRNYKRLRQCRCSSQMALNLVSLQLFKMKKECMKKKKVDEDQLMSCQNCASGLQISVNLDIAAAGIAGNLGKPYAEKGYFLNSFINGFNDLVIERDEIENGGLVLEGQEKEKAIERGYREYGMGVRGENTGYSLSIEVTDDPLESLHNLVGALIIVKENSHCMECIYTKKMLSFFGNLGVMLVESKGEDRFFCKTGEKNHTDTVTRIEAAVDLVEQLV